MSDGGSGQPVFSRGLLMTTRLLAALCMGSAVAAIYRFEVTTTTGRLIMVPSVLTSLVGQLFVLQASKPQPAAWVIALLPVFWVGLGVLVVLWLVALS